MLCGLAITAACHGPSGNDAIALRIAFEAAPTRIDPRYSTDAYSQRITDLVFSSLLMTGPDGSYRPYVAEAWAKEAGPAWRFRLRPDFLFHDGTPLRAADVVATYRAILDPTLGSPHRAALASVADVRADGDLDVVFRLVTTDAAFLEAATLGILPARQARTASIAPRDLVGSGPYQIVSLEADGSVRLTAFGAFANGPPTIRTVDIRVVPDALMRTLELRHGTIDFIQNALDPDTIAWLTSHDDRFRVYRGPSSNVQYLGMRLDHPALSDVRVRRAIAYAIDRRAIVAHLLREQARVATGILPPEHWAFSDKVRRYDYHPVRARRLLDRAGFIDPDGPGPTMRLTLGYKTTTQELPRRIAEAIAAQLARIGVKLEISTYEWGTFYADIRRGNFDLYSLQWVGIADPDIYRRIYHSAMIPPEGSNRGHYHDAHMDRLTERAARVDDRAARRRLYGRIQRLSARTLPTIALWWPDRIVLTSRDLGNYRPFPSGSLFSLTQITGVEPPR